MSDTIRTSNLHFGLNASNFNQPQIGFTSVGIGSTANYGFLQFFGTSNTLCWTANGTVGIGTAAPGSTMEVYTNGGVGGATQINVTSFAGGNTTTNTSILNLRIQGAGGGMVDNNISAQYNSSGSGTYSLAFKPSGTTAMTILGTGNVGIGVTNPSVKLHIIGTASGSTNSAHSNVEWGDFDASSYFMMGRLGTDATSYNSGAIYLYQNGFSTTGVTLSANGYSFMNGGNVGIGTTQMISTASRLMVYAAGNGVSTTNWIAGAFGPSAALPRVVMGTYSSIAIIGAHSTNLDAWANLTINPGGNVSIPGTLSKGGGSFDIHHPLSSDAKDRLVHSFVEGSRCDLIYRGRTTLVNGTAVVDINKECTHLPECAMDDGTFEALCDNAECFLQNKSGFGRVIGSISGATLTITAEHAECHDTIVWMVIAERVDPFIKTWDRTNSDGYLVTQYTMDYEPLTAATNYGMSV